MFHWICPECGREIAPTVRECPVCDPVAATVESALAGEVEAPARASNETSVEAPAEAAVEPAAPMGQLAEVLASQSQAVLPVLEPPPALAARVDTAAPILARTPHRAELDGALPQFGSAGAAGDPLGHLTTMLESIEPEPPASRETIPLPVRALPTMPAALRAFIAELQPAGTKARVPVGPSQRPQAAPEPPLLISPARLPLSSPDVAIRPLGAKLLGLPLPPANVVLPWTPPLELAPDMAPLGNYSPLAGRPLQPAAPHRQILQKETGPRTTLPGPMLTRRLVKFVDRDLSAIPPEMLRVKKRLIPGWMASALIIGTVLGAGVTSVISWVRPSGEVKQASVVQAEAPVAARPAAGVSPLVDAIEVTGFRIQMDPARKSEIQYLVVNHTPARFNGVTVYVTLYAADAKAGQPPLCRFQFAAPNLGPYQSKDMTSPIEQVKRPVTLPDWKDLRASVEIGQ